MRASVTSLSQKLLAILFAVLLALGLAPIAAFAESDISSEEESVSLPVGDIINEEVALDAVVAQTEATTSYLLAQTLESTRTVPIVNASLPLNMSIVGNESEGGEGDGATEKKSDEDFRELDSVSSDMATASTVVGSFEYRGVIYAIEPGSESVAAVAVDYAKLPEELIEAQAIVLSPMVTHDGINFYTVTRIADNAFSLMTPHGDGENVTTITIPASVTEIGDDAFTNFDTLQYIIVSEDNPNYGMYDGCLYDADLSNLLLIPEGRLGAVRIASSVTSVDPEVFSHCPSVDTLVADGDSAASQLLSRDDLANALKENDISIMAASDTFPTTVAIMDITGKVSRDKLIQSGSTALVDAGVVDPDATLSPLTIVFDHDFVEDSTALLCKLDSGTMTRYFYLSPSLDEQDKRDDAVGRIVTYSAGWNQGWYFYVPPYTTLWRRSNKNWVDDRNVKFSMSFPISFNSDKTMADNSDGWLGPTGGYGALRLVTSAAKSFYVTTNMVESDQGVHSQWVYTPSTVTSLSEETMSKYAFNLSTGWMALNSAGTSSKLNLSTSYQSANPVISGSTRPYIYLHVDPNIAVTFYSGEKGKFTTGQNWECWVTDLRKGSSATLYSDSVNKYEEYHAQLKYGETDTFMGWATSANVNPWSVDASDWWYCIDSPELTHTTTGSEMSQRLYAIYHPGFSVVWNTNAEGANLTDVIPTRNSHGLADIVSGDSSKYAFSSLLDNTLPKPTRNGFEFAGWYIDPECNQPITSDYFTRKVVSSFYDGVDKDECIVAGPEDQVNLYAKWKAQATWNANGGTLAGNPVSDVVYSASYVDGGENEAAFVAPPAPTPPGDREFAGWATTLEPIEGEVLAQPGDTVYNHLLTDGAKAGNPTFYARYQPKKSTVNFEIGHPDDGDVVLADGLPVPADYVIGDIAGLPPASYTPSTNQPYSSDAVRYPEPSADTFYRPGYRFLGWFDSGDAATATFAYFLTEAGKEVFGADMQKSVMIASDMTMYALWSPKDYAIDWYWNYPAYVVEDKAYPKTEGTDADLYRTDEKMLYGQPIEQVFFAAPSNARYAFDRWVQGRDSSAANVVGEQGSIREQPAGIYHFMPVSPESERIDFCALWNTDIKIHYDIMLYAGEGGTFSGGAASRDVDWVFDDPDYVLPVRGDNDFPTPKNGYSFANWVEVNTDGTDKVPVTVIESVPTGATCDRAFRAIWNKTAYTVSLSGTGELLPLAYGTNLGIDWDDTWSHGFDVSTMTSWCLPTAEQMNALNAAQNYPKKGMVFEGWYLEGDDERLSEPYVFNPSAYVAGFASHDEVHDAVFIGKWAYRTYTVVFDTGTDEPARNNMVRRLSYGQDNFLTLPVPVFHEHAGVFSHWDTTATKDRNKAWVSGAKVSIPDILDAGGYGETNVASMHVIGVAEDGSLVDETCVDVIVLHARWNGAHQADLPLRVSIAIDPETGDMVVAEAYLRTFSTNQDAVVVEGITYEKATATDGFGVGGGTDAVFGEILDRASLAIYAQKKGSEHTAELAIALNEPRTWSGAEVADIEPFSKAAQLDISYGLIFDLGDIEGATEKEKLVSLLQKMNLPDKRDMGEPNRSRLSFPIAKLYYTIGLVRTAPVAE